MTINRLLIRLLAISLATVSMVAVAASPIAIKAGRVFDSQSGRILRDQIILVRDDQIVSVGQTVDVPVDAQIIDLSAYTVMPGLIEAHAHLLQEHPGDEHNTLTVVKAVVQEGDALRALRGAARAKSYLDAGFTTVRDLGNSGRFADAALKQAINEGTVPGPRLYVSGPGLAAVGGQAPGIAPGHTQLIEGDYRIVRSVEDARTAVRENVYHGADVIKIYSNSSPNKIFLSIAEMKAIVEEAHLHGLKVTAHATTELAITRALDAGVDAIEHAYVVSDQTLKRMKNAGVHMVATDMDFSLAEKQIQKLRMNLSKDEILKLAKPYHERLRRAAKAEVLLAAGSDMYMGLGLPRGHAAKRVLFAYEEAGLSAAQTLQAATINGARLIGEPKLGILRSGAFADIIAVAGNPVENLAAIEKVVFVMKAGKVHADSR